MNSNWLRLIGAQGLSVAIILILSLLLSSDTSAQTNTVTLQPGESLQVAGNGCMLMATSVSSSLLNVTCMAFTPTATTRPTNTSVPPTATTTSVPPTATQTS